MHFYIISPIEIISKYLPKKDNSYKNKKGDAEIASLHLGIVRDIYIFSKLLHCT
jgi:hypothetical protein